MFKVLTAWYLLIFPIAVYGLYETHSLDINVRWAFLSLWVVGNFILLFAYSSKMRRDIATGGK